MAMASGAGCGVYRTGMHLYAGEPELRSRLMELAEKFTEVAAWRRRLGVVCAEAGMWRRQLRGRGMSPVPAWAGHFQAFGQDVLAASAVVEAFSKLSHANCVLQGCHRPRHTRRSHWRAERQPSSR